MTPPRRIGAALKRLASRVPETVRGSIFYLPATLLPRAATFVLVVFLTRILTKESYGLYALIMLSGEMAEMVSSNWIRMSLLRMDGALRSNLRRSVERCTWATMGATALVSGAVSAAAPILAPRQPVHFAIAVTAYVVAMNSLRLWLTVLQIRRKAVAYAIIEGVRGLGILAVGLIAQHWGGVDYFSFAMWVLLPSALAAAGACCVGYVDLPRHGASEPMKARWSYGLPIICLTALSYVVTGSDRLLLSRLADPAALGVYAAAFALARQPFDIVANSVNQAAYPRLVTAYEARGPAGAQLIFRETFAIIGLLMVAGLGIMSVASGALAQIFLPTDYVQRAGSIMPYIAMAALFFNLKAFCFDNLFHLAKANWLQLASLAAGAATTVGFGVFLIPRLGGQGAAITSAAGALAALCVSMWLSRRCVAIWAPRGWFLVGLLVLVGIAAAGAGVNQVIVHPTLQLIGVCTVTVAVLLVFTLRIGSRIENGE